MMDFPARYILIKPATPESLESRLKDAGGRDNAAIKSIIDGISELDESKTSELFDSAIVNDDLEQTVKAIGKFLYEKGGKEENKEDEVSAGDEAPNEGVKMEVDATAES